MQIKVSPLAQVVVLSRFKRKSGTYGAWFIALQDKDLEDALQFVKVMQTEFDHCDFVICPIALDTIKY